MRVISGNNKGKKLKTLAGEKVRPTSDRIKEALFNLIEIKPDMVVLDLFAGTGNVGIEALSRGAFSTTFIENSKKVFNILRRNVHDCKLESKSILFRGDVYDCLKVLNKKNKNYDLIFADPPYDRGHVKKLLSNENLVKVIDDSGTIILEHSPRELSVIEGLDDETRPKPSNWQLIKCRKYGNTCISILKLDTEKG